MKRRIFAIVMLLISMVMVFNLTACGGSKTNDEDLATPDEVVEKADDVNDYGILKIEDFDENEIALDGNPKLPCVVKMYKDASEAFRNSTTINQLKEAYNEYKYEDFEINFSFTSHDYCIFEISSGLFIKSNKKGANSIGHDYINSVGEIQTFDIAIFCVEETDTVVIPIDMLCDDGTETTWYIAFRIVPTKKTD